MLREPDRHPSTPPHDPSLKVLIAAYCVRLGVVFTISALALMPIQWAHAPAHSVITAHSATTAIAIAWTAHWTLNFRDNFRAPRPCQTVPAERNQHK